MRRLPVYKRNAFTLVEMMAALTVLSILVVGVGSTLVIASRAVDDGTAVNSQIPQARDIGDVIIADLNDALTITEHTAEAIAFTVPDRDDDGEVESIRYAWDGKLGGYLTRELNGSKAIKIANDVYRFDLTYLTRTVKPPPRACCLADGTCEELSPGDCTSNGGLSKSRGADCESTDCIGACCMGTGSCVDTTEIACTNDSSNTYRGDGSRCSDATCPNALNVLLVVGDASSPSSGDTARKSLFESWGHVVNMIDDNAAAGDFDTAFGENDVIYVSLEVSATNVGTKLDAAVIGIVNEEKALIDNFGFASGSSTASGVEIEVVNNTHAITDSLALGKLTVTTSTQPLVFLSGDEAAGLTVLAGVPDAVDQELLAVLELGATTSGSGTAPGRRVQLPWGDDSFDIGSLNDDGKSILKQSLEWAADESDGEPAPVCGDASCDAGEDPCNCSDDCGAATANEQVSFNCADGIDNDCDGNTDCDDSDCAGDTSCDAVCGDSTCEGSENSCNCAADCGAPAVSETGDTDCDDGIDNDCDGDIDCDDSECSAATPCNPFCGDGNCDTGENACTCSADCGAAPLTEANCEDSEDNDCDGNTDCDDSDCDDDAACADSCDCDGTYADDFESGAYDGSTGTLDWSTTQWVEIGEFNGPGSGNVLITTDLLSERLMITNTGRGVRRAVSLCAGQSATLRLLYRREGLNNAADYAVVEISSSGSHGPWTEIARYAYAFPGSDLVYLPDAIDISAFASESTWIRIVSSSSMNGADRIYFDNVQVTCRP